MTIIAGFKGWDGIVLCADTQETIQHFKRKVAKLRVEPPNAAKGALAVAFCGAGHGPFIDKVVERAWKDVQSATSLDDACAEIERSIKNTHDEFGRIYQPGGLPDIELIYGVKMSNGSKLFHAYGPVINEKESYASGVGYYMADFLASRMYRNHLDVRQLIILAAYIVFQAKEHVDGCGGDSHIAVLRDKGLSGIVDSEHVEKLTTLVKSADDLLAETLLSCANTNLSKSEFRRNLKGAVALISAYREGTGRELKELRKSAGWAFFGRMPTDDLGIPKPYKPPRGLKQLISQTLKRKR